MGEFLSEAEDTPEQVEQEPLEKRLEAFLIEYGFCSAGDGANALRVPRLELFELPNDPNEVRDRYYDHLEELRGDGTLSETVLAACVNLGRAVLQSRRGLSDDATDSIDSATRLLDNEVIALQRRGQDSSRVQVMAEQVKAL